jgi:hypothetical protein
MADVEKMYLDNISKRFNGEHVAAFLAANGVTINFLQNQKPVAFLGRMLYNFTKLIGCNAVCLSQVTVSCDFMEQNCTASHYQVHSIVVFSLYII